MASRNSRQPENGFYVVGMKSYGRAPTFLMLTGYEQVRSVVSALAGDWMAARDVQLMLPETGVCSSSAVADTVASACCAPTGCGPRAEEAARPPEPLVLIGAPPSPRGCCRG